MGSTLLKDQIVESMQKDEEGKIIFKVDLLRNYGKGHELDAVLPDTLKELYRDENIEYHTTLQLMKEIVIFSPKQSNVNPDFLEIYIKIDQLQRKLALELPMRQLLPF